MLHLAERRQSAVSLSVTPLIDIVFQLLIFFLLTANYLQVRVLDLQLPGEARGAAAREKPLIVISLGAGGTIEVGGQPVSYDRLPAKVQLQARGDQEALVLIDAHQDAAVQALVDVMDQIQAAGLTHIQLLDEVSRQRLKEQ
jgi:biopolymer transport protein ExbD